MAATAQGARVVRARLWVECSVRIATLITPVMFTTDLPIDRYTNKCHENHCSFSNFYLNYYNRPAVNILLHT